LIRGIFPAGGRGGDATVTRRINAGGGGVRGGSETTKALPHSGFPLVFVAVVVVVLEQELVVVVTRLTLTVLPLLVERDGQVGSEEEDDDDMAKKKS
jgi:hypothetical protein